MREPTLKVMTIFAILSVLSVHADQPARPANVPACVFDNVLSFGASVTAATAAAIPIYDYAIRGIEEYGQITNIFKSKENKYYRPPGVPYLARPYGLSPVRYLIKNYVGKKGLDRVTDISRYVTREDDALGSAQVISMIGGKDADAFKSATIVVGVDAFYWDAVWDTCETPRYGLDGIITSLIYTSKTAGKILILGTVPIEDPLTVRIDSNRTGVGMWWPPTPSCAEQINTTLRRHCTVTNRCYIADLKGTVDKLLAGEKLPLRDGGRYGLYDLRPDGVHLSDKGSRYLAELMINALETQPIACGK